MVSKAQSEQADCHCKGGGVRGFIQARILLELSRSPAYGYELMDLLGEDGADLAPDVGGLYRTLHCMEADGLVRSTWDTSAGGPARHVYEVTEAGLAMLQEWSVTLQRTRLWLDSFLKKYDSYTLQRSYHHVRAV